MRITSLLAPLLFLIALSSSPARAAAQMSTGEIPPDDAGDTRSRVAGELAFFFTDSPFELAALMPSIYASLGLAEWEGGAFVDLDLAWRASGVMGDTSAFRAMNPYVGVRAGVRDRRAGWRVRGGLGATAPLTNFYDPGFDSATPMIIALYAQGAFDAWLALPLNAAIVARGDVEYRGEHFGVGADTAFAALLPVEYQGRTGDTIFVGQLGVFALGRPIEPLALGVRFQAVAMGDTRPDTGGEGYLALMPFVRGELGNGFVEGRLFMNLDDPLGFAFDRGRYWAVSVTGGAAL